jgi:hypothetical protein
MDLLNNAISSYAEKETTAKTVSYNDFRTQYNKSREKGQVKATFKTFLKNLGLNDKVMTNKGVRCFLEEDVQQAIANYQPRSLKRYQKKSKENMTAEERKKAEARAAAARISIGYGNPAGRAIKQCSAALQAKYAKQDADGNTPAIKSLHSEIMAEFKKIDPKKATKLQQAYDKYHG